MNTVTTYSFASNSPKDTAQLAAKLSNLLHGTETIVLQSDLGGGKTTFVKALVAALGSTDHVSSPTFTVSKVYTTKLGRLVHFDFYRLTDPHDVKEALREEINEPATICCIEWPEAIEEVLPKQYITIQINKDPILEDGRTIIVTGESSLLEKLK